MTVSSTTPFIEYIYSSDGEFSFSFDIQKQTDLQVTHLVNAVPTTLILGTDYTVELSDNVGGTVTTTFSGSAGFLEIRRVLPIQQDQDLVNGEKLDLETIERALDRMVMILQQQNVSLQQGDFSFKGRGTWLANTGYSIGDFVKHPTDSIWYLCIASHISGTTFETTNWELGFDLSTFVVPPSNIINTGGIDTGDLLQYDSNQDLVPVSVAVALGTTLATTIADAIKFKKDLYVFKPADFREDADGNVTETIVDTTLQVEMELIPENAILHFGLGDLSFPATTEFDMVIKYSMSTSETNKKKNFGVDFYNNSNVRVIQGLFEDVSLHSDSTIQELTLSGAIEDTDLTSITEGRFELTTPDATTTADNHSGRVRIVSITMREA